MEKQWEEPNRLKCKHLSHSLQASKFASEHSIQLNERMEMLKTIFANFTEQHRMVLDNRTIDQFYEQDSYFSKIEEKYQHVILCLRKMIHDAEMKELLRQRQKNES